MVMQPVLPQMFDEAIAQLGSADAGIKRKFFDSCRTFELVLREGMWGLVLERQGPASEMLYDVIVRPADGSIVTNPFLVAWERFRYEDGNAAGGLPTLELALQWRAAMIDTYSQPWRRRRWDKISLWQFYGIPPALMGVISCCMRQSEGWTDFKLEHSYGRTLVTFRPNTGSQETQYAAMLAPYPIYSPANVLFDNAMRYADSSLPLYGGSTRLTAVHRAKLEILTPLAWPNVPTSAFLSMFVELPEDKEGG